MLKKSSPLKLLGKFGVIALFSSNFQNFNTRSRLNYEKLKDGRRTPNDGNTSHDPLGQV
jgi:cytochrome b